MGLLLRRVLVDGGGGGDGGWRQVRAHTLFEALLLGFKLECIGVPAGGE